MLLPIEQLARGPVRLERTYRRGEIEVRDAGLEAIGAVEMQLEARLSGPEVRVHLHFAGSVTAPCARCLAPVAAEVNETSDLVYHPASDLAPAPEAEIHAADTEVGFFAGPGLEVEEMLRERILLALPMRTLCREDCRGLCPHCGANRNEADCGCPPPSSEERWRGLAEWRGRG